MHRRYEGLDGAASIALSAALVAGAALALELAYGAPLLDAALYLAYEAGFVVLPGWLAYRALATSPGSPLRQLALGWALGYVLEILAFILTAAAGARWLLLAYPVIVAVPALIAMRRRGEFRSVGGMPSGVLPALAATAILVVTCIALGLFPFTVLPGGEPFSYNQDYLWALSIAGEAKHHWPITDPNVAGEPFPYHWFVHIHWAAASNVTGVDLPTVASRLAPLPLVTLTVLLFAEAGRSLVGSYGAGLLAVCLGIVVGELQLDTSQAPGTGLPFLGVLFTFMIGSPSFAFGLVFFLALLLCVALRLGEGGGRAGRGDWVVFGLLAVGAAQAKVSILPVLIPALALYLAITRLKSRSVPRGGIAAAGILLGVAFLQFLLLYRGHSSGLNADIGAGVRYIGDMPAVALVTDRLTEYLDWLPGAEPLISVGEVPFGLIGLLGAQLIGIVWVLGRRPPRLSAAEGWLLTVLAIGIAQLFFLDGGGGGNQLYGFFYAVLAGSLLSARGLLDAWAAVSEAGAGGRRAAGVATSAAVLLAALVIAPLHLGLGPGDRYLLWYLGLAALVTLVWLGGRAFLRSPGWAAVAAGAVILAAGLLDRPVETVEPALFDPPGADESGRRLTPELHGALTWVRDNTATDAVLAVNSSNTELGPYEFTHSAFAERRVFLGGWGYSVGARDSHIREATGTDRITFPGRLALNRAAFSSGSKRAIRALATRYGVRYLVIDEVNGFAADLPRLRSQARVVYRAPGVTVLAVPRG